MQVAKVLAVILVLALVGALGGCSSTGTSTSVIGTVQQQLCNPTAEQQATAAQVMDFVGSGVAIGASIAGVPITKDQALSIFANVRAGLCVGVTDLQTALTWFEALVGSKGLKAVAKKPDVTPLWAMLDKQ